MNMSQASVLPADSARFAAGVLTDAQVDAIFDSALEDGWCFHDIDDAAMRAVFRRAASISAVTAVLTDEQFKALAEHDREDGWCVHDFTYDALCAIFKRAAAFITPVNEVRASSSTSNVTIEQFIEAVSQIDSETFVSGQCHTLAGVFQELFGGELVAIIRNEVTEEGELFSTTYSHMVCEVDGVCYDIDGPQADIRWCEKWPDSPDEDGLTSQFEFVVVQPEELLPFIEKHRGHPIKPEALDLLRGVVSQLMPEALAPATPKAFPALR